MHYWWVNHKQTVRQEIEGGYLWSPKRTAGGARNQFYDNMRVADAGDAVLSFANGRVGYVGIITGKAFSEGKPKSFGTAGGYWSEDGWWVPVEWTRLTTPLVTQARVAELRHWLPPKYSPINPETGKGNQGAYLAAIPADLFHFVIAQSGTEGWVELASADAGLETASHLTEGQLGYDSALSASEQQQIVKARRGQGLFRFRVFQIESACRLTGITNPDLLIASHIKPWSKCSNTDERLDGSNGLLLTPHVDRLFDKGLISFTDSGDVIRSGRLSLDDLKRLGLEAACKRNVGEFSAQQRVYLGFHRAAMPDGHLP